MVMEPAKRKYVRLEIQKSYRINSYYISIKTGCYNDTKQENIMCYCSEERIHPIRCFLEKEVASNYRVMVHWQCSTRCFFVNKFHRKPEKLGAESCGCMIPVQREVVAVRGANSSTVTCTVKITIK